WSLERCRWWGGWAAGEDSNTLIKYAIDALQDNEVDYSDALAPVKTDYRGSLGGAASDSQAMTVGEGDAQFQWVNQQISTLISDLRTSNQSLMEQLGQVVAAGAHCE
ncbi:uncharacterized protein EI90DRAFT_3256577, partial [Cantharellus anzutake]|uniref:uncharacterized protein n=1 Tax=Cantharellus anzutake TaxID=1750568 RepID=UPI001902E0DD